MPSHQSSVDDSLRRPIGFWPLTALIINSVVGAGIFGLPGNVAKLAGPNAPWIYLLGGLAATLIVFVVIELSSQFTISGGAYTYVRAAFGPHAGIQVGCFSWLTRVSTAAAIANLLIASVAGFCPIMHDPFLRNACNITFLIVLAVVNIRGIQLGVSISSVLTVVKLLPLVALILLGFWQWNHVSRVAPAVVDFTYGQWIDALAIMVFAYSGFESAMIPGSKIDDPFKNSRKASLFALTAVASLYVLLHVVIMRAVPNLSASRQPLEDAARMYAGSFGAISLRIAAIISTLGWLSAAIITAPHLTFAMAQQQDIPAVLAREHPRFKTPYNSIILWVVCVAALATYGNFSWNVLLSVSTRLIVYSGMCASVMKLRRTKSDAKAQRMPLGNVIPVAGICLCFLLATRLHREHMLLIAIISLFGLGIWFASHRLTRHRQRVFK